MSDMTRLLNIGPWFLFRNFELPDLHYREEPADFGITLALANSGHMQFELILPLDDKPSPYRVFGSVVAGGFTTMVLRPRISMNAVALMPRRDSNRCSRGPSRSVRAQRITIPVIRCSV